MSEVETLNSLRKKLVSERRQIALRGADPQSERPEGWAGRLREVQELIETVDRAIKDEKSLRPAPNPRISTFD